MKTVEITEFGNEQKRFVIVELDGTEKTEVIGIDPCPCNLPAHQSSPWGLLAKGVAIGSISIERYIDNCGKPIYE